MEPEPIDLQLGHLQLHNVTQRTLGLLGSKGTGKTTLMKMINYKLSVTSPSLSLYIFDPLNVMHIAGFSRITVPRSSKDKGEKLARVLNKTTHDHLIIALQDMLQEEEAEFINGLFGNWKVRDSVISVDEMHDMCPEGGQHGTYCQELERAVRHWRNRNDGFIFATQRPAKLNKNVLELADAMNINRMTGNNDRDAVERYLKGTMTKDQAQSILGDLQHLGFLESYFLDFRLPDVKPISEDKFPKSLRTSTYLGKENTEKFQDFTKKNMETGVKMAGEV